SFDQAHLLPLLVRSYDIARAAVDLAAFATGSGLTAILEKFVDCDGSEVPIVVSEHPTLAALATAVKLDGADFEKILRGVLSEPRLLVPLGDLIEAVAAPQRARANCRRAMRSLIRLFIGSSRSAEAAGLAVQESLQISTSYLQKITQMSAGAAPGESVPEVTR